METKSNQSFSFQLNLDSDEIVPTSKWNQISISWDLLIIEKLCKSSLKHFIYIGCLGKQANKCYLCSYTYIGLVKTNIFTVPPLFLPYFQPLKKKLYFSIFGYVYIHKVTNFSFFPLLLGTFPLAYFLIYTTCNLFKLRLYWLWVFAGWGLEVPGHLGNYRRGSQDWPKTDFCIWNIFSSTCSTNICLISNFSNLIKNQQKLYIRWGYVREIHCVIVNLIKKLLNLVKVGSIVVDILTCNHIFT